MSSCLPDLCAWLPPSLKNTHSPLLSTASMEALELIISPASGPSGTAALRMLHTVSQNILGSPAEAKFRSLKTSNARVASLLAAPGALTVLLALGFKWEGKDLLVLPAEQSLDEDDQELLLSVLKSAYEALPALAPASPAAPAAPPQLQQQPQRTGSGMDTAERAAAMQHSAAKKAAEAAERSRLSALAKADQEERKEREKDRLLKAR